MSAVTLLRGFRAAPLRGRFPTGLNVSQRASIASKPAKGHVGIVETIIGLTVFGMTCLLPSGWFLTNLETYKKRD